MRFSTTFTSVAPRMPGLATATLTLHAPRSTAKTRLAIWLLVFSHENPRAVRHGGLALVLVDDLRVPDAGDRRADRREQRHALLVLAAALDLAPRGHVVGAARAE